MSSNSKPVRPVLFAFVRFMGNLPAILFGYLEHRVSIQRSCRQSKALARRAVSNSPFTVGREEVLGELCSACRDMSSVCSSLGFLPTRCDCLLLQVSPSPSAKCRRILPVDAGVTARVSATPIVPSRRLTCKRPFQFWSFLSTDKCACFRFIFTANWPPSCSPFRATLIHNGQSASFFFSVVTLW